MLLFSSFSSSNHTKEILSKEIRNMLECSKRNKMHFGEVSISLSYSSKGKYMSDKSSMLHAIIGKTERIRICRRWWWWIWSTFRLQLQLFLKRTLNINSLFPPPLPFLSLVGDPLSSCCINVLSFSSSSKGSSRSSRDGISKEK